MIPFGKISAVLGIIGALSGGVIVSWPVVIGDAPLLANRERLEAMAKRLEAADKTTHDELESLIMRGFIRGTRRAYCEAIRTKNGLLALQLSDQLSDQQDEYYAMAKHNFLLQPCP